MFANSASGAGLSIRATGGVRLVSGVRVDIPDRPAVLAPDDVYATLCVLVVMLAALVLSSGVRYPSGIGTQWLDCGKVPRLSSAVNVRKSGSSTPACPSTMFVFTA